MSGSSAESKRLSWFLSAHSFTHPFEGPLLPSSELGPRLDDVEIVEPGPLGPSSVETCGAQRAQQGSAPSFGFVEMQIPGLQTPRLAGDSLWGNGEVPGENSSHQGSLPPTVRQPGVVSPGQLSEALSVSLDSCLNVTKCLHYVLEGNCSLGANWEVHCSGANERRQHLC